MTSGLGGLEVIRPGLLTTIQDSGRPAHRHEGVPLAGAADPVGLAVANLLAGNAVDAAALECTLLGPELVALADLRIGIGGADLGARIMPGRRPVMPGWGGWLRADERIAFDAQVAPESRGCRAYVAVGGGLDVPVVLGSRSTSLAGSFGGLDGRPLRAGDILDLIPARGADHFGPGDGTAELRWPADLRLPQPGDPIRVVPGPGLGDAAAVARTFEAFVAAEWRVAPASDRRGVRLDGAALPSPGEANAGSHGMVPGAIQVTPAGQPLVLLTDAGPTGGYPVIGVVAAADTGLVAQARPGDRLRFEPTGLAEAREALAGLRATLRAAAAMLADQDGSRD